MKLPSALKGVSRSQLGEVSWKWRYKLSSLGRNKDKGLDDFSSDDESDTDSHGGNGNGSGSGSGSKRRRSKAARDAKDAAFGTNPVVSTLYEGPDSTERHFDWVSYPPKQLSRSAAKAADRVAIKVYRVKDEEKPVVSGRWQMKPHMIEVQNAGLVEALKDVLKGQDVHLEVNETARFRAPFRPLFFGYDAVAARHRALGDEDPVKPFLKLFLKVLDDVFGEVRARRRHLQASGLVSFGLAWAYFAKDAEVISWGNNCELLSKVKDTTYRKKMNTTTLVVNTKVLRFNGEAFVWEDVELEIQPFQGNIPITEMIAYPLEFHKDPEATKERMAQRGRMVLDYQGLTYCSYEGIGLLQEGKTITKHNVEGRILIDVVGYRKYHLAMGARENLDPYAMRNTVFGTGRYRPPRHGDDSSDDESSRWTSSSGSATSDSSRNRREEFSPPRLAVPRPGLTRPEKKTVASKRLGVEEQKKNREAMLAREDDLVFMNPLLEGYALKNKLWLVLYVEDIKPLVWNEGAFDHLVYDEEQKDLVLSFVESHGHAQQQLEDVIVGKGQGLVVLLSGPPGTGKTLTAEAVADRTHRPLFYLQAEDLGINALSLGANVKRVFEMANEWDAVILLDEADVFMAERAPHDIARNELVSIFLRELEYFRGVIFLTTNLFSTIDAAFRSRVSLHLLFHPLTPDARLLVWRKFLGRLPPPSAKRAGRRRIADVELNGDVAAGADAEAEPEKTTTLTLNHGTEASKTKQKTAPRRSRIPMKKEAAATNAPPTAPASRPATPAGDEPATASPSIDMTEPLAGAAELSEEDLRELSLWQLNGREIKNAIKMVKSWCDHKGYGLTLSRIEHGIKATSPHAGKLTHERDVGLYDD